MINKDELLRSISHNVAFADIVLRFCPPRDQSEIDRFKSYADEGRIAYRFLKRFFDEDNTLDSK